jgi:hypothetical protein
LTEEKINYRSTLTSLIFYTMDYSADHRLELLLVRVKPPIKILFLTYLFFVCAMAIIRGGQVNSQAIINCVIASYLFFWASFFVIVDEMIRLGV